VAKPKLPYLYRIPSRQGVERWYFWRGKGHPRIRISEEPGTAAFHARYVELLDAAPATVALARPQQRTLGWLASAWLKEIADTAALEQSSKNSYRRTLTATLAEVVIDGRPETYADMPLDRVTAKTIRNLRNRKQDAPAMANLRLRVLNMLFVWAMEDGQEYLTSNPASDVKLLKTRKGGFHTWPSRSCCSMRRSSRSARWLDWPWIC
jgi:hypothetical protein